MTSVLIVESDKDHRDAVRDAVAAIGHVAMPARSVKQALGILMTGAAIDAVVVSFALSSDDEAMEIVQRALARVPPAIVVVTSPHFEISSLPTVARFLQTPYPREALRCALALS